MQANEVAEQVEMIDIMQPAVHGGNPWLGLAAVTPKLRRVDLPGAVLPARVPGHGLASMGPDMGHHLGHEGRIGEAHLVRANVDVST